MYTKTILKHLDQMNEMIEAGALFVVNHSGGKDSQAMYAVIKAHVPAEQIFVIHADLPGVEWDGLLEHIEANVDEPVVQVRNQNKTFLEMVERRGMWPSASTRQCTSDLKRDPLNKEIRHEAKRRGTQLIVSCMGIRAEESPARAKKETWKLNKRESKAGRTWVEFMPIHDMLVDEVFAAIEAAGQTPFWTYGAGMTRLSCVFCILASQADLRTAGRLQPELAREYVDLEARIGHTFQNGKSLAEILDI